MRETVVPDVVGVATDTSAWYLIDAGKVILRGSQKKTPPIRAGFDCFI